MTTRFLRFLFAGFLAGALGGRLLTAGELVRRSWSVDGVKRDALLSIPAGATKGGAPVVFVFHGHRGTMQRAAKMMPMHEAWPEAIVVYPQGLPTAVGLVDPEGKYAGWQAAAGAPEGRDVRFFDQMYEDLVKTYHPDPKRCYVMGHSNGGYFSYLLWAERSPKLAAVAASAATLLAGTGALAPKPVFHIGSPRDNLVKFSWQEETIKAVLKLNAAGPFKSEASGYTFYSSSYGNDVAVFLHRGGHSYPDEATALVAKFFRDHPGH